MNRFSAHLLTIGGIVILAALLGGYAFFQAKKYLTGPVITIIQPKNGVLVASSTIEIVGTAENIAFLTLNDRKIFVDETGTFRELLLLPAGYSIMKLEARDRFGRTKTEFRELMYQPQ